MKMTYAYGAGPSQFGELHVPEGSSRGTICLFHGGFWKVPYDLMQMNDMATHLTNLGYHVWNIEYTRVGEEGRAWQDTFDDAIKAINHLKVIKDEHAALNLDHVVVAGHSAGGHLAIWLGSRSLEVEVTRFIGLAPVLDLELAHDENTSQGVVAALMGGTPKDNPQRYMEYSPLQLIDHSREHVVIHGADDADVPVNWSRCYVAAAKMERTGLDLVTYIEVPDAGHMDFLDPSSQAFRAFVHEMGSKVIRPTFNRSGVVSESVSSKVEIAKANESNIIYLNSFKSSFCVPGYLEPKADGKRITYDYRKTAPRIKVYEEQEINPNAYISSENKAIFFAMVDGDLAGQVILNTNWNGYGFIEDIRVKEEYKGCGVGMALMDRAKDWAVGKGLGGLTLETQNNNVHACKFYERCGFVLGGFDHCFYKQFPEVSDETVMYWYWLHQA